MQNTLLDPTALLDNEQRAWLDATMARNRDRFAGWAMEDPADPADPEDPEDPAAPADPADPEDPEDPAAPADPADPEDPAGPADPKDDDAAGWKAKFEAEQRHKRNLERKARKDAATISRLTGKKPEGGGKDPADPADPEKIRDEARAEARREALSERVADKIEAKASKFADPEDAVAVLLRSRDIEDFIADDKVDVEAITDALKELGEKKPHLLAQGSRFKGDADGGRRKGKDTGRPKSLGDAISRHYADGSK